jgi:hypothetical protein
VFVVLSISSSLVNAGPASKEQVNEEAIKACRLVTNLVNPSILKSSAYFPAPDEVVAFLVQGMKPPPSMKNQLGAELCLYSLRTKSAHLAAWDVMANFKRAPTPTPSAKEF